MTGFLPEWVYEFHPHEWLFVFPVAASAMCFGMLGRTHRFVPILLVSTAGSTVLALLAIMIELGRPWALIGVTGTFIFGLYLPVCLAVGLLWAIARRIGPGPVRG